MYLPIIRHIRVKDRGAEDVNVDKTNMLDKQ